MVGSHWVLCQEYTERGFMILDPYIGQAYIVSKKELSLYLDLTYIQHIIYLA
jgi:hypothetical protein